MPVRNPLGAAAENRQNKYMSNDPSWTPKIKRMSRTNRVASGEREERVARRYAEKMTKQMDQQQTHAKTTN